MSVRIGKAEVRLSIGVLPLFAALIVLGEGKALALAVLSLFLHECAHAIAAKNLGYAIRRVSLYPFGAVMDLDPVCAQNDGEWIAALAGPLGSFVTASVARLFCHLLPAYAQDAEPFVHTNAALALLNLLPAYPLDGGRIAKSLLLRTAGERAARRVSLAFTAVICALLVLLGVYCLGKGLPAWTLFGIAPYLLVSAWTEWKRVRTNVIERVIERRTAAQTGTPLLTQTVLIDGSATLGAAMRALSAKRFTIFRIESQDRRTEADENALIDAASRCGYDAKLKDVFFD